MWAALQVFTMFGIGTTIMSAAKRLAGAVGGASQGEAITGKPGAAARKIDELLAESARYRGYAGLAAAAAVAATFFLFKKESQRGRRA